MDLPPAPSPLNSSFHHLSCSLYCDISLAHARNFSQSWSVFHYTSCRSLCSQTFLDLVPFPTSSCWILVIVHFLMATDSNLTYFLQARNAVLLMIHFWFSNLWYRVTDQYIHSFISPFLPLSLLPSLPPFFLLSFLSIFFWDGLSIWYSR